MRASFTVAWSELRRRRLQSAVIVIMVALASSTITLGLNLLLESRRPYDRAFEAQSGAYLKVFYDARHVTPAELTSTSETIGASSAAGPWPDVYATLLHRESSDGQSRYPLDLVGRDSAQAPAERFHMTSGRWVEAPGEVVITRAFAAANDISLGDHLVSLHTADKPALTVVGEVVDISQTSPASDYSSVQRHGRCLRRSSTWREAAASATRWPTASGPRPARRSFETTWDGSRPACRPAPSARPPTT
jgi:putative ABC transport system permease protein